MGIQDREYYRDDTPGYTPQLSATGALIALHACLFFVLALTAGAPAANPIIHWGGFNLDAVQHGQIWRLLTSHLIPSRDLVTFIMGMYLLYWAGRPLEGRYGSKRFLVFYLAAGFVAGITKLVLGWAGLVMHPSVVGLAAPLCAVLVLYAFQEPRHIVRFFFVLPVQVGHLVMVMVGVYLLASVNSYVNHRDLLDSPSVLASVAYATFFHYRGADWIARLAWNRPRRSSLDHLRIYDGSSDDRETPRNTESPKRRTQSVDEHLEAKLDEVLEKLAKYGPEHLTGEEQQVLIRASEAYQRLRK